MRYSFSFLDIDSYSVTCTAPRITSYNVCYTKLLRKGDTSHFQALTTALSGTVGTGNIAGVALAIHLGGPAALFWMLVTAALGMTTKFVEVTLSHKYRETAADGSIAGGPMYYMKNRLNMKWLAAIFAVATVLSSFGTGSLPQINSISSSLFETFGINHMLSGGILSVHRDLLSLLKNFGCDSCIQNRGDSKFSGVV